MKTVYVLVLLFSFSVFMKGQNVIPQDNNKVAPSDTIVRGKGTSENQIKEIKKEKVKELSDSTGNEPKKSALVDTTVQNKYGDMLNDDTLFNKRYPAWIPALESFCFPAATTAFDRYALKADYAHISLSSWNYNIQKEWEWDSDGFGINFIGHPYSGSLTFNAGRANGYNFYQSSLFAVEGSLLYEYFGENTRPSMNDLINTSINGAFLGEILYRLSSNFLDDRTKGLERVSREILAGIIDPVRGLNRILQGKSFRVTNKEVYQKEPLNITIYGGFHIINDAAKNAFLTGTTSEMANVQLDYGNPFENRSRKPYDFFKLRTEFNVGVGKKVLDNITGYGLLTGKNVSVGKSSILFGIFQYYDYWNNLSFELGALAFGGGVFSKIPIGKSSVLYINAHLGVIPFAGNSRQVVTDTSQYRDYDFGDGLEAKLEATLNIGTYATASMIYYYYFMNTYVGVPGSNTISILKPRVTVRIYKRLSIGLEEYIYFNDRYQENNPANHSND